MGTSEIDKIHIPREEDGRYTLKSEEDEKQVLEDLKHMTQAAVCEKWGISRTKIYWLKNPEKYKEQLEKNKQKKVYDKDKARVYKQRNRAKKKALREKGSE